MRRLIALAVLAQIGLSAICCATSQAEKYHEVLIPRSDVQMLIALGRLGLPLDDVRPTKGGAVEIPLTDADIDLLRLNGIPFRIVQEDLERYYANICRENMLNIPSQVDTDPAHMKYGSMGGYYNFSEIVADLDSMHLLFPAICASKVILGYGWNNNPIYMVKISDNPDIDEEEPEALFDAAHHAREVGGYTSVLYAMWWLLENYGIDPEATYLINNRELYFVPVVNPDGLLYNELTNPGGGGMWRKNRRNNGGGIYGVDNVRNYTYQWGYDDIGSSPNPSALAYRGPYAGSEPETQAMMNFITARNFHTSQTFHTYGGWYLSAYCYADTAPEAYDVHQEYMRVMAQENNYEFGYAGHVFYFANGTSQDYQLHDHGILVVAPETGRNGFYSPISFIIPEAAENLRACLHTAWTAGGLVEMTELAVADGQLTPGQTESLIVTLQNKGWGTSEPVDFQITTSDPYVSFNMVPMDVDSLQRRAFFSNSAGPIIANVATNCPIGHKALFTLSLNQGNFTRAQLCSLYVGEPIVLFMDGAETGLGNWIISNSWGLGGTNPHAGNYSFSDSPGGNYSNNANAIMTLANPLNLNGYASAWLEYWTRWDIQCLEDFGQVEISTNGGISWLPVSAVYTTPGSGQGIQPLNQPGYDGASPVWLRETIDLNPYLGQSDLRLRFEFRSNEATTEDGWYIDDIKVLGFAPSAAPALDITLTPINPPIQIPPSGGSFNFDANLANNESSTQNFDVWIMTQLPNSGWYGPLLGPINLTLGAGAFIARTRTQSVPGSAPAGTYIYMGYVGDYPTTPYDSSSFNFTKLAAGDGSAWVGDFDNWGESFGLIPAAETPADFALFGAYPNPFNPQTAISYQLAADGNVRLMIYDTAGRLITTLVDGWREAGRHEVIFDGSKLSSGIYLCCLAAGDFSAVGKLVLLK